MYTFVHNLHTLCHIPVCTAEPLYGTQAKCDNHIEPRPLTNHRAWQAWETVTAHRQRSLISWNPPYRIWKQTPIVLQQMRTLKMTKDLFLFWYLASPLQSCRWPNCLEKIFRTFVQSLSANPLLFCSSWVHAEQLTVDHFFAYFSFLAFFLPPLIKPTKGIS